MSSNMQAFNRQQHNNMKNAKDSLLTNNSDLLNSGLQSESFTTTTTSSSRRKRQEKAAEMLFDASCGQRYIYIQRAKDNNYLPQATTTNTTKRRQQRHAPTRIQNQIAGDPILSQNVNPNLRFSLSGSTTTQHPQNHHNHHFPQVRTPLHAPPSFAQQVYSTGSFSQLQKAQKQGSYQIKSDASNLNKYCGVSFGGGVSNQQFVFGEEKAAKKSFNQLNQRAKEMIKQKNQVSISATEKQDSTSNHQEASKITSHISKAKKQDAKPQTFSSRQEEQDDLSESTRTASQQTQLAQIKQSLSAIASHLNFDRAEINRLMSQKYEQLIQQGQLPSNALTELSDQNLGFLLRLVQQDLNGTFSPNIDEENEELQNDKQSSKLKGHKKQLSHFKDTLSDQYQKEAQKSSIQAPNCNNYSTTTKKFEEQLQIKDTPTSSIHNQFMNQRANKVDETSNEMQVADFTDNNNDEGELLIDEISSCLAEIDCQEGDPFAEYTEDDDEEENEDYEQEVEEEGYNDQEDIGDFENQNVRNRYETTESTAQNQTQKGSQNVQAQDQVTFKNDKTVYISTQEKQNLTSQNGQTLDARLTSFASKLSQSDYIETVEKAEDQEVQQELTSPQSQNPKQQKSSLGYQTRQKFVKNSNKSAQKPHQKNLKSEVQTVKGKNLTDCLDGSFEEDMDTAEYDNEVDEENQNDDEDEEAEIHFDIENLNWLKGGAQALYSDTVEAQALRTSINQLGGIFSKKSLESLLNLRFSIQQASEMFEVNSKVKGNDIDVPVQRQKKALRKGEASKNELKSPNPGLSSKTRHKNERQQKGKNNNLAQNPEDEQKSIQNSSTSQNQNLANSKNPEDKKGSLKSDYHQQSQLNDALIVEDLDELLDQDGNDQRGASSDACYTDEYEFQHETHGSQQKPYNSQSNQNRIKREATCGQNSAPIHQQSQQSSQSPSSLVPSNQKSNYEQWYAVQMADDEEQEPTQPSQAAIDPQADNSTSMTNYNSTTAQKRRVQEEENIDDLEEEQWGEQLGEQNWQIDEIEMDGQPAEQATVVDQGQFEQDYYENNELDLACPDDFDYIQSPNNDNGTQMTNEQLIYSTLLPPSHLSPNFRRFYQEFEGNIDYILKYDYEILPQFFSQTLCKSEAKRMKTKYENLLNQSREMCRRFTGPHSVLQIFIEKIVASISFISQNLKQFVSNTLDLWDRQEILTTTEEMEDFDSQTEESQKNKAVFRSQKQAQSSNISGIKRSSSADTNLLIKKTNCGQPIDDSNAQKVIQKELQQNQRVGKDKTERRSLTKKTVILRPKSLQENITKYQKFLEQIRSQYMVLLNTYAPKISSHFTCLTSVIVENTQYEFPSVEIHKAVIAKLVLGENKHFSLLFRFLRREFEAYEVEIREEFPEFAEAYDLFAQEVDADMRSNQTKIEVYMRDLRKHALEEYEDLYREEQQAIVNGQGEIGQKRKRKKRKKKANKENTGGQATVGQQQVTQDGQQINNGPNDDNQINDQEVNGDEYRGNRQAEFDSENKQSQNEYYHHQASEVDPSSGQQTACDNQIAGNRNEVGGTDKKKKKRRKRKNKASEAYTNELLNNLDTDQLVDFINNGVSKKEDLQKQALQSKRQAQNQAAAALKREDQALEKNKDAAKTSCQKVDEIQGKECQQNQVDEERSSKIDSELSNSETSVTFTEEDAIAESFRAKLRQETLKSTKAQLVASQKLIPNLSNNWLCSIQNRWNFIKNQEQSRSDIQTEM